MEAQKGFYLLLVVVVMIMGKGEGQLREHFYNSSCHNLETIVRQAVFTKVNQTRSPAPIPATLRLFFHDCFVEGCDSSIMITSPKGDAEKDAPENLSLAKDGFDMVIMVKKEVERACPRVVSCADILALAARDVVVLAGGPSFNVELGRRDGLISQASRVAGNIPPPSFNLTQLTSIFAKNNLTQFDMIALSGAHTIGVSHCRSFSDRLYSFSFNSSLNPDYAMHLMKACPENVDNPATVVLLDPSTPQFFDNMYYKNLIAGKGLLNSDAVLFTDPRSRSTVDDFAKNAGDFNGAFATSMRKLGRVGVKTGDQGIIKIDCTAFH